MKTPYYLIDEAKLERNLKTLAAVRKRAGVKILLAQKAFSAFDTYSLVAKYLDGTTASGLYEARLAHEEMPTRENHVFNPAFTDEEFAEVAKICDYIVLNSVEQVRRFVSRARIPSYSPRSMAVANILHAVVLPHFSLPEMAMRSPRGKHFTPCISSRCFCSMSCVSRSMKHFSSRCRISSHSGCWEIS